MSNICRCFWCWTRDDIICPIPRIRKFYVSVGQRDIDRSFFIVQSFVELVLYRFLNLKSIMLLMFSFRIYWKFQTWKSKRMVITYRSFRFSFVFSVCVVRYSSPLLPKEHQCVETPWVTRITSNLPGSRWIWWLLISQLKDTSNCTIQNEEVAWKRIKDTLKRLL